MQAFGLRATIVLGFARTACVDTGTKITSAELAAMLRAPRTVRQRQGWGETQTGMSPPLLYNL